jgi:putative membrane protein
VNAVLNGTSAILIASAHNFIRRGNVVVHRGLMIAAVATSSLFFASYIYYHAHVGSVHFQGQGIARPIYFAILITHTLLAASIPPLVIITLTLGLRRRDQRHKRIARWTYPIWLYVSITGVVIYLMLYHIFRAPV